MTEINKSLFDFGVHRQLDLTRYGNGVVRDILALLNGAEAELVEKIRKRGERGPWTTARLKALLAELRELSNDAYWDAQKLLAKEMKRLAKDEAEVTAEMLAAQFPPALSVVQPGAAQLAAIVDKTPITVGPDKKLLLEEIFVGLAAGKEEAIRGAVRLGVVQGETVDQMIRRLRGTRANGFKDGILETNRRHAASVVRTICNHTSNQAVQTTYKENSDLVEKWTFLSTLDSRTTIICASLSGTEWPIGEGPLPPRHVNCRSFALPKLKTWRELGIDLDEMPPSVRASKDGPVRADITFDEWLGGQSKDVQKEVLGATRQQLFTEGKMKIGSFTDDQGKVYNLDQLKERHRATFSRIFG